MPILLDFTVNICSENWPKQDKHAIEVVQMRIESSMLRTSSAHADEGQSQKFHALSMFEKQRCFHVD